MKPDTDRKMRIFQKTVDLIITHLTEVDLQTKPDLVIEIQITRAIVLMLEATAEAITEADQA